MTSLRCLRGENDETYEFGATLHLESRMLEPRKTELSSKD